MTLHCVLDIDFTKVDARNGQAFMSQDAYGHPCTVVGSVRHGNQGFFFDGTDDYINMGAGAGMNNHPEFSIEIIAMSRNIAKEQSLMHAGVTSGDGTTPGFRLNVKNSKVQFALEPDGAAYTELNANRVLEGYVEHHIIGTYKDETNGTKVYVDGTLDAKSTIANITTYTRSKLISHTWKLEGSVKRGRMWNRALTPQEVLNKYIEERHNYLL